ncbi:MAG: hypothetical protein KGI72_05950 [Patescibacteria group bacterium]|nr:hypothetical protein [Patescibacteria group bacterium]MDE2016039.1 hypothetical protein [Patescibacteria group bacterium]
MHGDMVEAESSWAHIQAGRLVMEHYGVPVKYYADQHSIFRFVQNRDSNWRKNTLFTDDTDPQWKQVIIECGSSVTYALSPQAKGKIERPYQWLQDRVVRTCAKEQIKDFKGAREVFRSEVKRYNTRTVHSTTGEIPIIRFEKAVAEGKSLFRPFTVPEPFLTPEDIFCFRVARIVDGYRKISLNHVKLAVPRAPIHSEIQLRILPRPEENSMEVRMWWNETFLGVHTVSASDLPLERITGL